MGQQVNRSSKVKSPSESDCIVILRFFCINCNNSGGLVTYIRPEGRWSYQDQIIMDRTGECCITLRRVLISGEMPIWPPSSWFSTKHIKVWVLFKIYGGTERQYPTRERVWLKIKKSFWRLGSGDLENLTCDREARNYINWW